MLASTLVPCFGPLFGYDALHAILQELTYLWNQNLVARLYTRCNPLAILVKCTGSNSQYFCLVQLLHCGLGEEDAGRGLGLGLHALDEDAVEERGDGLD